MMLEARTRGRLRLNLPEIARSLRDVQREIPKINEVLRSGRDSMTDEVVENVLAGYAFIDRAIAEDIDLLTPMHAAWLLELNSLVLCGADPQVRTEYHTHLQETARRFYRQEEFNIDDILRW